jgi:hypothetical protein
VCDVQVSDFGLTKFKADLKRAGGEEVQGTIHWTAPEVLEDRLDVDYVQADVRLPLPLPLPLSLPR